jgi:DNA-binding XRE family transcriptional regulator
MSSPVLQVGEKWQDIPEYKGYYQISNRGRVRSLDRTVPRGNGFIKISGIHMKNKTTKAGYKRVGLTKLGLNKRISVHRLVLIAFCGQPPTPKHTCNHKDGIKGNNYIDNLEWVTQSENMYHAYSKLNRYRNTGELHSNSKLTESDVLEIRRLYATENYMQTALAKLYSVDKTTIWGIVNRVSWKHI